LEPGTAAALHSCGVGAPGTGVDDPPRPLPRVAGVRLVAGQPECVVKWSGFDRSTQGDATEVNGPAGDCPLALVSLCLALGDGYGEAARALLDKAGCFPVLVQHL